MSAEVGVRSISLIKVKNGNFEENAFYKIKEFSDIIHNFLNWGNYLKILLKYRFYQYVYKL